MAQHGKPNKALGKRFKITRNKKMIHRSPGQNHFLAKRPGQSARDKRHKTGFGTLAKTLRKSIAN